MTINVSLNQLANLQNENTAVTQINQNSNTIAGGFTTALNTTGDKMLGTLDMNSYQILNLPTPGTANSPARLSDIVTLQSGGTVVFPTVTGGTNIIVPSSTSGTFVVSAVTSPVFTTVSTASLTTTTINATNITTSTISSTNLNSATANLFTITVPVTTTSSTPGIWLTSSNGPFQALSIQAQYTLLQGAIGTSGTPVILEYGQSDGDNNFYFNTNSINLRTVSTKSALIMTGASVGTVTLVSSGMTFSTPSAVFTGNVSASGSISAASGNVTNNLLVGTFTSGNALHNGNLTVTGSIVATGNITSVTGNFSSVTSSGPYILPRYTVTTLPASSTGMIAMVTDATSVAFATTVVGGGTGKVLVLYTGSAWVEA